MNRIKSWVKVSLLNFLIAGIFGTFMRYDFIKEIPWLNYVHMESTHWHLALFGWIYLTMYSFLVGTFLPDSIHTQSKYDTIFWCSEVLILLDILSDIIYGYNFISIGMDVCLFLFIGYFIYCFLKDLKKTPDSFSNEIIKIALFFLALSFCGVLFMIPVEMLFTIKRSILYYLSTQFFLHFNYNGWFTFSVFALFFRIVENQGIPFNKQKFERFKWTMVCGAFLTYFLSIYWGYPGHYPFLLIASIAAFVQLSAILYVRNDFLKIFKELKPLLNQHTKFLFQLSLYCYLIKLSLQAVIIFPKIAYVSLTIRNYMISYFHLMFLGVTSAFLIGYGIHYNFIRVRNISGNLGVLSFIIGFILLELLLVFQGTLLWLEKGFLPLYYESVFAITVLLPVGLFLILLQNFVTQNIIYKKAIL